MIRKPPQKPLFGALWFVFVLNLVVLFACGKKEPSPVPTVAPTQPKPAETVVAKQPTVKMLPALRATSRVVYVSAPTDPHRLQVTLGEPDHARIRLASDPETEGRRLLHYVAPTGTYFTDARSATSEELQGLPAHEVQLWVLLRRNLYNWGSDSEWKVDPLDPARMVRDLPLVGRLAASFEKGASLPSGLFAFDEQNRPVQSLCNIAWEPNGTPPTPRSLDMFQGEAQVWREEGFQIQRGQTLRADYFLPSDRRSEEGHVRTTVRPGK